MSRDNFPSRAPLDYPELVDDDVIYGDARAALSRRLRFALGGVVCLSGIAAIIIFFF